MTLYAEIWSLALNRCDESYDIRKATGVSHRNFWYLATVLLWKNQFEIEIKQ